MTSQGISKDVVQCLCLLRKYSTQQQHDMVQWLASMLPASNAAVDFDFQVDGMDFERIDQKLSEVLALILRLPMPNRLSLLTNFRDEVSRHYAIESQKH